MEELSESVKAKARKALRDPDSLYELSIELQVEDDDLYAAFNVPEAMAVTRDYWDCLGCNGVRASTTDYCPIYSHVLRPLKRETVGRQCIPHPKDGNRCIKDAIKGGTVCGTCGGGAPQVRARANVVAELAHWGVSNIHDDPGEVLLRLVTQSAARAKRLGLRLAEMEDEEGFDATVMSAVAELEANQRDRCANSATNAVAAGLAERQVRMAERQGELMVTMVTAALIEAAVPDEYATAFKVAPAGQVRAIGA